MKLGGWKSATRRQKIIIASVGAALAIGGAGMATAVSVSAHNAAAEQAAAEAIAAKNAEEEEAARAEGARLTAARDDAVSKASEGEALLTDSEMWGDPDAREELRDALGVLVALQADESASAEALECPASSSWQDFFCFKGGGGGVGQAEVHLQWPVPGDRLMRALGVVLDSVVLGPLDERQGVRDLVEEQSLVLQRPEPAFA